MPAPAPEGAQREYHVQDGQCLLCRYYGSGYEAMVYFNPSEATANMI